VERDLGDSIRIQELEISARIGVTHQERVNPQRLVLDVIVWPKTAFDQLEDDITRAVNYVELCRRSREFVQSREWNLIETVSAELASHLIRELPLKIAQVEVRKFVLPNTKHVSATATRSAAG
jgi:dihydroneopterin aldolase